MLAPHEGEGYARWLAGLGLHAWVLQYRLGPHGYRHPAMLHDAARAVRTVRALARRNGQDPARVGIFELLTSTSSVRADETTAQSS